MSTGRRPALIALAALAIALGSGSGVAAAQAAPAQPGQPQAGPGGSSTTNADVRVSSGGTGSDAWFVFEPTSPQLASAPLTVITHGYFEFSGYDSMQALIRHTVRRGSIVIYPRWQTTPATPCPGPFDIEPCIASEVAGIKGALASLQADPSRVQPQLDRTSYFGFSFGGIVTANMLNRYQALGLPEPRAVFLDDPHDGGYTGTTEPALDPSLAGIPASTKLVCHSGAEGVTGEPGPDGRPTKPDASCNSLFPKLTSISEANKDIVLTSPDDHGSPALSSKHGVCTGQEGSTVDAYDFGFCFKQWDSLRSCALEQVDCPTALGDTPEHRHIGTWSDGVPIVGLKIQERAPIRPTPVPARAPAPAPEATAGPAVTTPAASASTVDDAAAGAPATPTASPVFAAPSGPTSATGTSPTPSFIVRFYGRRRSVGGVLVTLSRSSGTAPAVVVELRRAGRAVARSRATTVGTQARRIVLRASGGRRLSAGRYALVVRSGGGVVQRRIVVLGR